MNHNVSLVSFSETIKKIGSILFLAATIISMGVLTTQEVFGANTPLACSGFPINVSSAAELEEAIGCFNAETAAGTYTINLQADIALTSSLSAVDNTTTGAVLEISGGNFTVDGQDIPGLRPFAIFTDTHAIFKNMTITGGNVDAIVDVSRNETSGAAILNYGDLTLNNVVVTENNSRYWGGGIFSESSAALTLIDSEVSYNFAGQDGGGIQNFGDLTLSNSLIQGNTADRYSGGIGINAPLKNINISNSTIYSNTAGQGAGIYNRNGTTIIASSTITGNVADDLGGGIFNNRSTAVMTLTHSTIDSNYASNSSAGIHNDLGAQLTILNSSVTNNSVDSANTSDEAVGGIKNDGGQIQIQNSTISGNVARIGISNNGLMTLTHVTIANNMIGSADIAGLRNKEQVSAENPVQLWLYNTSISDHPVDCLIGSGSSVEGNVGNLIETDSSGAEACSTTDTINADPQLLPLGDYGGDTETHSLSINSPLIDAADAAACAGLIGGLFDQRGISRNNGTSCDIGAYESTTEISINDVTVQELENSVTQMVFTITRNSNEDAFDVFASTQDDTATAGSDYVALNNQKISFAAGGALSEQVTIIINNDIAFEGDETFKLVLSGATGGEIIDGTGIGTIQDFQTVELAISADSSIVEGDSGSTLYQFTFTLNGVTGGDVTVNYKTSDGSATVSSGDYEFATGSITLDGTANGDTATVTVQVFGDIVAELNETFYLEVTSVSNSSVGANPLPFEAVIENDDAPTVSFSSSEYAVPLGEDATITLQLSALSSAATAVLVTSSDGTATAGDDYTAVSQTVTFNTGEGSQTIVIPIATNVSGEDDETFTLTLSNYDGLSAGTITTAEVTIISRQSVYLPMITR